MHAKCSFLAQQEFEIRCLSDGTKGTTTVVFWRLLYSGELPRVSLWPKVLPFWRTACMIQMQQSRGGMEMEMWTYMCYTAWARKAFGTLALALMWQLCQTCESLSTVSICL